MHYDLFEIATGRYVVLLNSDVFLQPGSLELSVRKIEQTSNAGLGGALPVGRDDAWQTSARLFPSLLNEFLTITGLSAKFPQSRLFGRFDRTWADPNEPAEIDWVPGAFSIISRDVLQQVGGFDERYFLYYEEVDLCRRIKAAVFSVWYWPVVVVHLGGESLKTVEHLSMSSAGAYS